MERLTKRMDHGIIMAPGYDFGIDPDDYDLVQEILDRLAAYEDTGLEPEEVEIMRESKADAQFMLTELCRLCDYDRLEELAKAEREGRLVVLPCKVGDAAYIIDRKFDILQKRFVQCVVEGYVKAIKFSHRPTKITVEYPDPDSRTNGCKGADYFARNIGKTVFLTREEAEATLKGGEPDA